MIQVSGIATVARSPDKSEYHMALAVRCSVESTFWEKYASVYIEDLSQDTAVRGFNRLLKIMHKAHIPHLQNILTTGEYPFTSSKFIHHLRAANLEHIYIPAGPG